MPDDNTTRPEIQRPVDERISAGHEEYLRKQAVDLDLARSLGVRTLSSRADTKDLGGVWVNWANFPALLFPWTNEAGHVEYQVRPDDPTEDSRGRKRKYVFQRDMTPVLWAVRPVEDAARILIVEGTKQGLAAASYAPDGVAVYAIAGCRSWQIDGMPIPDLATADGREVVVILDADAADNMQVYQAGLDLAEALDLEGATKISFGRLPGAGKSGLDDVLAGRPADKRAGYLARIIDGAKPKPADTKPKPKKKGESAPPTGGDRPIVICNRDRFDVINDLAAALTERWNGREMFNHGGVISRFRKNVMTPVDRGTFHDVIQETARTMNENEGANGTTYSFAWPDAGSMAAVMSRADAFSPLDRISRAPFARPDGTIVTEPGYDEETKTLLIPSPELAGLTVPEEPSAAEIETARELLLTEWFGDFPFDGDADRANALALMVTPAIRGMVPRVPLAVLDGLQMGVGKNLFADCLLTVYTGSAAKPMNWVSDPDELRKQITSAFREGSEFFVFDEAHTVEGAPLAQALTAETWQDRILGVSTMANFPNRVTWMALGNQVQVKGDVTRRVYRIALRPKYADPQDRQASSFRHPGTSGLDLGSWTRAHRRELMTAILTLVRAWFAQSQPYPKRGVSFGSFEAWEKIVGGIVETAGLPGFLDNLKVWRSESDFDTQYWIGHIGWLAQTFGDKPFRTADVREAALTDPAGYLAPPKLDDPADKSYGKALGESYSRLRGRRYGGRWVERLGSSHGHVSQWRVFGEGDAPTEGNPAPAPDPEPVSIETYACPECGADTWDGDDHVCSVPEPAAIPELDAMERTHETLSSSDRPEWKDDLKESVQTHAQPNVLTFDLETGEADNLYKIDEGYIRIGATAADDQDVEVYDTRRVANYVGHDIRHAGQVTGHNIMAFDLPALVRAGQLTMPEVHDMAAEGRLFDGLLAARYLDPPMARDKGVDATRKYDLGAVGEKYGLGEKLTDVSKPLAKKYGGWGEIPIDVNDPDPERAADAAAFRGYMVQDVELSRSLHARLMKEFGGTMPAYLTREHRVAALAAQISINGFLVDQELLADRVDGVNRTKAESLVWLKENAGIPTANAKGVEYKSPLASKGGKVALEAALRAAGATSLWRTGKSGDLDTSGEHMKHLAREYAHLPAVKAIAERVYRIVGARSVYQTILDNLCPDGRVHPKIGFAQATGRWSVTAPGLTVLGKRGGRHVERAVLLPDPGEVNLSFDLSQVDMRAVAGLSQDRAYIRMLESEDPHTELAIALFGDARFREQAKAIGHGWNYGESLKRISEENEIEPSIVRKFDTSMRDRFGRLVEWREEVRTLAGSGALLDNGFGRRMRADPRRAHTQGPALLGQGAARDIMMTGLLRLPAEVLPMLRAQIHDEIVLSVPVNQVEDVTRTVINALSFDWKGVPIMADVSRAGTDWSKCYEKG